jgi:hypothetical protein
VPRKEKRCADNSTGPRKSTSATAQASAYHLIDLTAGLSHGGFDSLAGARQRAREKGLLAWDIFHGNVRVEYHDPREVDPVHPGQRKCTV